MGELMNTERVIEGNLFNLFAVKSSLCDSDTKNWVKASTEYTALDLSLDSVALLSIIKKPLYTGGTNNLNVIHNKSMAYMNLMTFCQDSKTYKSSGISTWLWEWCVMS